MANREERPGGSVVALTTFATLGVLNTVQEIAAICLQGVEGADPELVAEETLSLVSVATARAVEVALKDDPESAREVGAALLELPFLYRDYLIGGALLAGADRSLVDASQDVYQRLGRKREFYAIHLGAGQFPGEHALRDVMALWMGRLSPPRLPEPPQQRLERLGLVAPLFTHLRVVLAFGRRGSQA